MILTGCHYNTGFVAGNRNPQGVALRFPMYILYRILTAFGMLFLAPYYALRSWRRGEGPRTFHERFGDLPAEIAARAATSATTIWIHAVSVGEVLAAKPHDRRIENLDGIGVTHCQNWLGIRFPHKRPVRAGRIRRGQSEIRVTRAAR